MLALLLLVMNQSALQIVYKKLENAHGSPQEQDAILKPGSQHCEYHVIGPLDIFHRIEEIF